jgi:hypothetical protein
LRWGRRPTILLSHRTYLLGGLLTLAAPAYFSVRFRWGRRPTILLSHGTYLLGGLLTLAAPAYFSVVTVGRLLVGTAHHTISHLPYLLGE